MSNLEADHQQFRSSTATRGPIFLGSGAGVVSTMNSFPRLADLRDSPLFLISDSLYVLPENRRKEAICPNYLSATHPF